MAHSIGDVGRAYAARQGRVTVEYDPQAFLGQPQAAEDLHQFHRAQDRGHDVLHDDVGPIAEVQDRHDRAVQHGKRIDNHEIVGVPGQGQDAGHDLVVDVARLDGVGGRGQEVQTAGVRHGQLPDEGIVQPVLFADHVAKRRRGGQIEQRCADAHLQRGIDQEHAPGVSHGQAARPH